MKQKGWILVFSVFICFLFSQSIEAQQCPDLIIRSLTMSPTNPYTSDNITFKAVIQNIGRMPARPSIAAIRVGGETNPKEFRIPGLLPGRTTVISRVQQLSKAQNYRTTAYADYKKGIRECREDNNTKYINFRVGKGCPDLIVRKLSMVPTNPTTSTNIRFTAVITNIGNVKAPASVAAIRVGGETNPRQFRVPALPARMNFTINRVQRLTRAQNYRTTAYADFPAKIKECKDNNNSKYINFRVTSGSTTPSGGSNPPPPLPSSGCPDLTITRIVTSPTRLKTTTKEFKVLVTVRNIGRARAPASEVKLLLGSRIQPTLRIPGLNPGQSHTATSNRLRVSLTTMRLEAHVGFRGTPKDCNPRNNKRAITLKVAKPPERQCYDLAIHKLTVNPARPKKGTVKIIFVVKNKGNIKAPASSLTLFINNKPMKSIRTSHLRPNETDTITFSFGVVNLVKKFYNPFQIIDRKTFPLSIRGHVLNLPLECDGRNNIWRGSFTPVK